jgi:hypothetical protein
VGLVTLQWRKVKNTTLPKWAKLTSPVTTVSNTGASGGTEKTTSLLGTLATNV